MGFNLGFKGLKAIKRDMNSDCSNHRHNTKIQNTYI